MSRLPFCIALVRSRGLYLSLLPLALFVSSCSSKVEIASFKSANAVEDDPEVQDMEQNTIRAVPFRMAQICQELKDEAKQGKIDEQTEFTVNAIISHVDAADCTEAVKKIEQLDELDLSYQSITDVAPLMGLPGNIKTLNLDGNLIADILPLAFTKIENLSLVNNSIKDLKPLESLDLKVLNVSGTAVASFLSNSLPSLINLSKIVVSGVDLSNMKFDLSKTRIAHFDCNYCQILSLEHFLLPHDLTVLKLTNNGSIDLKKIGRYSQLKFLNLNGSVILNPESLSNQSQLVSLFLASGAADFVDLSQLAGLKNLENLNLGSNQGKDFSGDFLKSFGKLRRFMLTGYRVSSYEFLNSISVGLEEISIRNSNPLTDLSYFARFENLEYAELPINVQGPIMGSFIGLPLRYFECEGCFFSQEDLDLVTGMKSLEYLIGDLGSSVQNFSANSSDSLVKINPYFFNLTDVNEFFNYADAIEYLQVLRASQLVQVSSENAVKIKELRVELDEPIGSEIINEILKFTNIDSLSIVYGPQVEEPIALEDLSALENLSNLRNLVRLQIVDYDLGEGAFLEKLDGLRQLFLINSNISSLTSLRKTYQLRELEVLVSGVGHDEPITSENCVFSGVSPQPLLEYCNRKF